MPEASLRQFGVDEIDSRTGRDTRTYSTDGVVRWLKETADRLQVTATALRWRLVALKLIDPARAKAISADVLRKARRGSDGDSPPLFSKPFMEVLGQAIDEGRVSARRVADLLHLTIEDLRELFARYSVAAPLDL
jgi:hypothetical protein